MLHLDSSIRSGIEDVCLLLLSVVVEWVEVIDHHWMPKELRQDIAANQMRCDFLEEVLLVFVDLVGLATSCALICRICQWRRRLIEYFFIQFLKIIDIKIWYLLHDAEN